VGAALDRLAVLGLAQKHVLRSGTDNYGFVRLSVDLYVKRDERGKREPFSRFPAPIVYGGLWSMLPTSASRHLMIVLACLDRVKDEEEILNNDEDADLDAAERERKLARTRSREPVSLSMLEGLCGFARPTVCEALKILTTPSLSANQLSFATVRSGDKGQNTPTWYALDRRIFEWSFASLDMLNSRENRERLQESRWPWLVCRRNHSKVRREQRAHSAMSQDDFPF
jgi:hypothetical protein